MNLSRREMIRLGVGLGALALIPKDLLSAQEALLIQRLIPSTGETIPVVGIGTARRYDVGPAPGERAPLKEVLRRFKEMGGKVIDTAPSYGTAETVVGDLVAELGIRDSLFLATKVDKRGREAGAAEMEESREKLRTEKIDLVAVHNLIDIDTQLGTLKEWKAAGRIRYLGMTTSFNRQHDQLLQVMARTKVDFVQVDYALDERGAADRILPMAADRGMAVMINLPFGRGRLFKAAGNRMLPEWTAEFDCKSWGQFFLKYIISNPTVTCVIPGTAKVEYLLDNMGAARGRLPDVALRRRMEEFVDRL